MVKNVPHLEITEVVLFHRNIVNNYYQHDSGALYVFVPKKQFGHLLNFSPQNFLFLRTCNSDLSCIKVWLTDQISEVPEVEIK